MNKDSSTALAANIPVTPGIEKRVCSHQAVAPNGVDVVWEYAVELTMADAKSGNFVVRTFREDSDALTTNGEKVIKEMMKEMKLRRKASAQRKSGAATVDAE